MGFTGFIGFIEFIGLTGNTGLFWGGLELNPKPLYLPTFGLLETSKSDYSQVARNPSATAAYSTFETLSLHPI